jgi:hypothetical protein
MIKLRLAAVTTAIAATAALGALATAPAHATVAQTQAISITTFHGQRLTPPTLTRAAGKQGLARRGVAPNDTVACSYNDSILSTENLDYVSAELGYTGANYAMLRARATTIGPWEKFDICDDTTAGYWYIASSDNLDYVSAELGYTGANYAMLRARATSVGPWEKFTVACDSAGQLVFISQANALAVSTELGYSGAEHAMLRARANTIGPWEQYSTFGWTCP